MQSKQIGCRRRFIVQSKGRVKTHQVKSYWKDSFFCRFTKNLFYSGNRAEAKICAWHLDYMKENSKISEQFETAAKDIKRPKVCQKIQFILSKSKCSSCSGEECDMRFVTIQQEVRTI